MNQPRIPTSEWPVDHEEKTSSDHEQVPLDLNLDETFVDQEAVTPIGAIPNRVTRMLSKVPEGIGRPAFKTSHSTKASLNSSVSRTLTGVSSKLRTEIRSQMGERLRKPPSADSVSELASPSGLQEDSGAAAADRTMRSRSKYHANLALVGQDPSVIQSRAELVSQLAKASSPQVEADALRRVAELKQAQGEPKEAEKILDQARRCKHQDAFSLSELQRVTALRHDSETLLSFLHEEATQASSRIEKEEAWISHALVTWQAKNDLESAIKSAKSAYDMNASFATVSLITHLANHTSFSDVAVHGLLLESANRITDQSLVEVIVDFVIAGKMKKGNAEEAESLAGSLIERLGKSSNLAWSDLALMHKRHEIHGLSEHLGLAVNRTQGAHDAHAFLAAYFGTIAKKPMSFDMSTFSENSASWSISHSIAYASGDIDKIKLSLSEHLKKAQGTQRLILLLLLSETKLRLGESTALTELEALTQTEAVASQGIELLGELADRLGLPLPIAFRHNKSLFPEQNSKNELGLGRLAVTLADGNSMDEETAQLAEIVGLGTTGLIPLLFFHDALIVSNRSDELLSAIKRLHGALTPSERMLRWTNWAQFAECIGNNDFAVESMNQVSRDGFDLNTADLTFCRKAAQFYATRDPQRSAQFWAWEGRKTSGTRSAFAYCMAGRILAGTYAEYSGDVTALFEAALLAVPSFFPAADALEAYLLSAPDTIRRDLLIKLNTQRIEHTIDSDEVASRWIRNALIIQENNAVAATEALRKASVLQPSDHTILIYKESLGHARSSEEWSQEIEAAQHFSPSWHQIITLRAAAAMGFQGNYAQALELCETTADASALLENSQKIFSDVMERIAGDKNRIGERIFETVKHAKDKSQQIDALKRLALFDLVERQDPVSAVLSHQAILESDPNHLPSLRALERHYMTQQRDEDLLGLQDQLINLLDDPKEKAVRIRFAIYLKRIVYGGEDQASHAQLLGMGDFSELDPWFLYRIFASGEASGDWQQAARSIGPLAEHVSAGGLERAALALRLVENTMQRISPPAIVQAVSQLLDAQDDGGHILLPEIIGRLLAVSDPTTAELSIQAAEAFEIAALRSHAPARQAAMWYLAGGLWQDRVGDELKATHALMQAASLEPTLFDVHERTASLLQKKGDREAEIKLVENRIRAGASPENLGILHLRLFELYDAIGDRLRKREALKNAAVSAPENPTILRLLADEYLGNEEWKNAAEMLIRLGHVMQGSQQISDIFLQLGELYEDRLNDSKRAEAAYARVLKQEPGHLLAATRLSALFRQGGQRHEALDLLKNLHSQATDPEQAIIFGIQLSEVAEQLEQLRFAEQILDAMRKKAPTHIDVINALVRFYTRQNARTALSMHYNRAAADCRDEIDADLLSVKPWQTLAEVLQARGDTDGARCAAASAVAMGIVDLNITQIVDQFGLPVGAKMRAFEDQITDALADHLISPSALFVCQTAYEAMDRALPFDTKEIQAERLIPKKHPAAAQLQELAKNLGIAGAELLVSPVQPRMCVPINNNPCAVIIGHELLAMTSTEEREFLFLRALFLAQHHLTVVARTKPRHLEVALYGLMRACEEPVKKKEMDEALLEEMTKRLTKHLSRKVRPEIRSNLVQLWNTPDFDAQQFSLLARHFGNRAAFLSTGSLTVALSALLKLQGANVTADVSLSKTLAQNKGMKEAQHMVSYSVSESYFEARRRLGLNASNA